MAYIKEKRVPSVPFTMYIDYELWQRVLDCVAAKKITRIGAIREGLKMWLAANEGKVA